MNWPPSLAIVSALVGVVLIATRLPGIINPPSFRTWMIRFPRSEFWGRVLMVLVAVLAGWNLNHAASDNWAWARPVVWVGVPVAYWLIIQFASSFLAVRASAALLLFVAKLMMTAADRSDHPLRLVVTILAYIWVVIAIWAAVAPHHVRDVVNWLMNSDNRCRLHCGLVAGVGAVLIVLGAFVYS